MSTETLQKRVQGKAYQIVKYQLGGVVALSLLAFILCGFTCAYSVLLGGCAYVLPNLVFVWRVFKYAGASQVNQFMLAFLMGEMIKLALAGFLFLMIVKYLPVGLLSVLAGFFGAMLAFWVASFWLFARKV